MIYALSVDGKSWQLTTVPSLGVGVLVGERGAGAGRPATRDARRARPEVCRLGPALCEQDLTFCDKSRQIRLFLVVLTKGRAHLPVPCRRTWPVARVSVRRVHGATIQLRSMGLNALSLRSDKTTRFLHASLRRWLD